MSLIHFLTAGHLDPIAVGRREIVVTRPLDVATVIECVRRYADPDSDLTLLDGSPLERTDGYVRCLWYAPRLQVRAVRFVLELHQRTGCVVADVEHARLIDHTELANTLRGATT
jgi:hypothetical protein